MNRVVQAVLAALILFSVTAECRERESGRKRSKHTQSVREIDHPLTLPQRTSNITPSASLWANYFYYDSTDFSSGKGVWYENFEEVIFTPYSYGINDSLQISVSIAPSLQITYQFYKNTELKDGVLKNVGPSFAAYAGVSYGGVSMNNYVELAFRFGVYGKAPLNQKVWLAPNISFSARHQSKSVRGASTLGVGFQLNDRWALKPHAGFEMTWVGTGRYSRYNPNYAGGFFFNPRVGVETNFNVTHFWGFTLGAVGELGGIGHDFTSINGAGEISCWFNW